MNFLGFNPFGFLTSTVKAVAGRMRSINAGRFWDAEQNDAAIKSHFSDADGGAAEVHASPEARKKIRERARFEYSNSGYVRGIVDTHVNGIVGSGPRLSIDVEQAGTTYEIARLVERGWEAWAIASQWYDRLRLSFQAEIVDGEGLAILSTDEKQKHPVKLAWKLVECDQLESPIGMISSPVNADGSRHVDGVDVDAFGRHARYYFLKTHPGSMWATQEFAEPVNAEQVIHLFHMLRPGQTRGVSALAPMLVPAAMLRQYTNAVLKSARRAASLTFVMKTSQFDDESPLVDPYDSVPIHDDAGMTLPEGYDIQQLKPEQPTGTYGEFKREIVSEMARPFGMPYNKAAADSSSYNYASGRLDHQDHGLLQRVKQDRIEIVACDTTFVEYCKEAVLRDESDLFPPEVREFLNRWLQTAEQTPPHMWHWDQVEHADPAKEASADAARLTSNTTTLQEIYAKRNKDWRRSLEQRASELRLQNELGITNTAAVQQTQDKPDESDEPEPPAGNRAVRRQPGRQGREPAQV